MCINTIKQNKLNDVALVSMTANTPGIQSNVVLSESSITNDILDGNSLTNIDINK